MAVKCNQKAKKKKKLNVFNFYGYTAFVSVLPPISVTLLTVKHASSDLSSTVKRTEANRNNDDDWGAEADGEEQLQLYYDKWLTKSQQNHKVCSLNKSTLHACLSNQKQQHTMDSKEEHMKQGDGGERKKLHKN